ncbi:MAG: hypothetical protein QOE41_2798 [Mycobacterium sp.]|nr:hypothetical protein [Mycobacterium sp.]MDT5133487.1 hypothetical protein [Mycobacterium sp.]
MEGPPLDFTSLPSASVVWAKNWCFQTGIRASTAMARRAGLKRGLPMIGGTAGVGTAGSVGCVPVKPIITLFGCWWNSCPDFHEGAELTRRLLESSVGTGGGP